MRFHLAFSVGLLAAVSGRRAAAADPPAAPPAAPSAVAVQEAVARGTAWLRTQMRNVPGNDSWQDPVELCVLTLAHVGGNASDKTFAERLAALESSEPRFTYRTALLAMALAEVNPRLYQGKLAHCAQWFVDTQLPGGEWGYPGAFDDVRRPASVGPPPPPAGAGASAGDGPPGGGSGPEKPPTRIVIAKRETTTVAGAEPAGRGDFSNTQFAILGLRACREGGVDVPPATWKAALGYLQKFQRPDGGWGYVLSGQQDDASYASLTAAGVCSAAICHHALGSKDPKKESTVVRGLAWLKSHPDVTRNAGIEKSAVLGPSPFQCYHLYSVERAARVLGLSEVGGKPWYDAGAAWLLGAQKEDGRWEDENLRSSDAPPRWMTVADTCFALLFLTRATRPLTGR
jgi:hypothetical protein